MNSIAVDSVTKNTVHIKLSAINMQLMQVFMVSSWNNDNNVHGLKWILNWQLCVLNHRSCDNRILWQ